MTREEAIRILDPETMGETLAEIEYYGGFRGRTKAAQALSDACIIAVAALREQEERRWIPVTERLPDLGERVLISENMLRDGGDVFLDDVTPQQVEQELGVPLIPVKIDGGDLFDQIFEVEW